MKKFNQIIFLACGLLLMLAATSVFAQEENAFRPNKKPLEDFAQLVKEKVDGKQVDLTKPFSVELTGVLDKDGKFDPKTAKFTKSEGDAAMIEVGKSFIAALNDSGLFYYQKQLGIEKISFIVGQDDNRTYGIIVSEQISVEKAKTISSGMNLLVKMVSLSKQNGANKLDADTEFFLNGIIVNNDKKIVKINFNYEKSAVQEMINRKLKESTTKQSNGE